MTNVGDFTGLIPAAFFTFARSAMKLTGLLRNAVLRFATFLMCYKVVVKKTIKKINTFV